jgi:hypothetical protein
MNENRVCVEKCWPENEVLGEKSGPVILFLPQIPHGSARDWTRVSAVEDRLPIVRTMLRLANVLVGGGGRLGDFEFESTLAELNWVTKEVRDWLLFFIYDLFNDIVSTSNCIGPIEWTDRMSSVCCCLENSVWNWVKTCRRTTRWCCGVQVQRIWCSLQNRDSNRVPPERGGGGRGKVVGWGTALHVGRSRVRFPMV